MDIFITAILCYMNARIVSRKNRNPLGIIAITLSLTLGIVLALTFITLLIKLPTWEIDETMTSSEMIGVVMTGMSEYLLYITYIPLIIGGGLSWVIAKNMKPGKSREQDMFANGQMYGQNPNGSMYGQNPNGQVYGQNLNGSMYGQNPNGAMYGQNPAFMDAEPYDAEKMLRTPCTICVIRENAAQGAQDLYTVSLNGYHACRLANETYANIMTNRKQNTITARDGSGASLLHPISFMAVDGGYVEIHISGGEFLPEKTIGRKPAAPQS